MGIKLFLDELHRKMDSAEGKNSDIKDMSIKYI